jgi:hypothetical protein
VNVSDLMEAMSKAGAPMEAIILAVRALEEKDAVIEARRANDRERKRRQRGTITGQSRDTDGTVTGETPSLDKSPPDPQKLIPTPHTHGGSAPAREAAPKLWACPEGVELPHWRDFLGNRRRKKLGTSETAYLGQLKLIGSFASDEWPPGRLVQHAAEKGWGTIVDPSEYETPRNGQRTQHHPSGRSGHRRADEIDDAARQLGFT